MNLGFGVLIETVIEIDFKTFDIVIFWNWNHPTDLEIMQMKLSSNLDMPWFRGSVQWSNTLVCKFHDLSFH